MGVLSGAYLISLDEDKVVYSYPWCDPINFYLSSTSFWTGF